MRDEIDRLILLPVEQFREQMIMKFKAEAFDAGFQFVKAATDSNQDLASVEVEDFTEQLKIKLSSLFDDPQQADDFLAFCLDYLIANRP